MIRHLSMMFVLFLLFATDGAAQTIVKVCDSDVGPGQNLSQAIATGGIVYFQCPPGSRIRITKKYTVSSTLTIDGANNVTLDGQGLIGPFLSVNGTHLILRRASFTNFRMGPPSRLGLSYRASVVNAGLSSFVELDHATFEGNESAVFTMGDITVLDSTFVGNRGVALAAAEFGKALVQRTDFRANEQGLSAWEGTIVDSNFIANTGTAIRAVFMRNLLIRNNTFQNNRGDSCIRLSQRGARGTAATVKIRANRFLENDGGGDAGAITVYDPIPSAPPVARDALRALPPARFEIAYNRFFRNRGTYGGAVQADLSNSAGMRVLAGSFVENTAQTNGGALAWSGGALSIEHSLFRKNSAVDEGAAIYGSPGKGALVLSNSVVAENDGPKGAIQADRIEMINVTVARNRSSGLVLRNTASSGSRISNSILSENRPRNCENVALSPSGGKNLQFPNADCTGIPVGEVYLDSLYVPSLGSPALLLGDASICQESPINGIDLAFQGRRNPRFCALGAYERPPIRFLKPPREDH